jgi:tRNA threonylcarbamoyladenosine biosynthesis protein TsaE
MEFDIRTESATQTIEFGRRLGRRLSGGEIIGLIGRLGTGKTHLIKGIAAGAGAAEAQKEINSPTFVIINEYHSRLSIYHIDAYRLNSAAEFEMLGFDDYCRPDSVVLIEWADKVLPVLDGIDFIRVELSHLGPQSRSISISNAPEKLLKNL